MKIVRIQITKGVPFVVKYCVTIWLLTSDGSVTISTILLQIVLPIQLVRFKKFRILISNHVDKVIPFLRILLCAVSIFWM